MSIARFTDESDDVAGFWECCACILLSREDSFPIAALEELVAVGIVWRSGL